jgi:Uma2 family endonuclease
MTATAQMPMTAKTLKMLFDKSDFIAIPATEAEFWHLVELPQYHLEFHNNQIVGTMSYATTNHERIVSNLIFGFRRLLDEDEYDVFGSNRPIFAAQCDNIYEPDVHIIEGVLSEYHYAKTKTASQNPAVVVEVFSPSTKEFDKTEKLECYKMIPSLKHIVFIEPNKTHIQLYNRANRFNEWTVSDFVNMDDKMTILNKQLSLKNIYKKVILEV